MPRGSGCGRQLSVFTAVGKRPAHVVYVQSTEIWVAQQGAQRRLISLANPLGRSTCRFRKAIAINWKLD
eukprot:s3468_g2.t1